MRVGAYVHKLIKLLLDNLTKNVASLCEELNKAPQKTSTFTQKKKKVKRKYNWYPIIDRGY